MGNKLLVRAYNVGVGDCIYVRIPDGDQNFHILIDCGTIGSINLLKSAIKHIEEHMLPDADEPGKKRLDLVVVTHRHRDVTFKLRTSGSARRWTNNTPKRPKR